MIGERIREARKRAGWSQARLAKAVAVEQNTISDWERGRAEPARLKVRQIALALHIEPDQLETDHEPELATPIEAPSVVTYLEPDVRASAGGGVIVDDDANARDVWTFSRRYLASIGLAPHNGVVIEIIGDSMAPTLQSGDRVLVDCDDRNPALPGIFVLNDGDALVAKRLERIPASDPAQIMLISDNAAHGRYTVLADQINIVGRVVWVARRL